MRKEYESKLPPDIDSIGDWVFNNMFKPAMILMGIVLSIGLSLLAFAMMYGAAKALLGL